MSGFVFGTTTTSQEEIWTSSIKKFRYVGLSSYDTREHSAGGYVDGGFVVRDRAMLMTSKAGRGLRIEIGRVANLPNLIASLVLQSPDEDESPEEFAERLKTRDDVARAFYEAALRIEQAARE
ncbi:hypothetical protein GYB70_12915 [Sinorhizobium meliloti]|nr:hypothetical protein [Sinorhizobium meliloti]